jgi:hypothetical protein
VTRGASHVRSAWLRSARGLARPAPPLALRRLWGGGRHVVRGLRPCPDADQAAALRAVRGANGVARRPLPGVRRQAARIRAGARGCCLRGPGGCLRARMEGARAPRARTGRGGDGRLRDRGTSRRRDHVRAGSGRPRTLAGAQPGAPARGAARASLGPAVRSATASPRRHGTAARAVARGQARQRAVRLRGGRGGAAARRARRRRLHHGRDGWGRGLGVARGGGAARRGGDVRPHAAGVERERPRPPRECRRRKRVANARHASARF